ncbi:MAG TPA: S9 family peptidase [Gemmatimonadaceae bacterium]|jgi:dipeptidyl aminopeptidase/acylaminoacyl peptidase|nr:S9 family peptidase [Gemmatimonadaceae bacterium]
MVRVAVAATLLLVFAVPALAQDRRPISVHDVYAIRTVSDPALSPDGQSVAYTVTTADSAKDRQDADIWLTRWDGSLSVRLTQGHESHHLPRWSPDGQWLAFLSSRGDKDDKDDEDQLWVLDRVGGGEAERITSFKGGVDDYAWSPDGSRLVVVATDPPPDTGERPIVINRFQFKADITGYLTDRRDRLYLVDRASHASTLLSPGASDAGQPAWSPDGRSIAYVRKTGEDIDRGNNWDLYVMDVAGSTPGAPRQLTTYTGSDNEPDWSSPIAWSPDSRFIAYTRGGDPKMLYYTVQHLYVIPAAGGEPRALTASLDRSVTQPQWSADGSTLAFLVEDDRAVQLATVPSAGGSIARVDTARHVISGLSTGRDGRTVVLASTFDAPPELFAREGGTLRPLTTQNAAWRATVTVAPVQEVRVPSDGEMVSGFVVLPPGYVAGKRYPTILRIHGGPVLEYGDEFEMSWQLLAARGYVVVAANPRGSSGRGQAYASAIFADWGNKDSRDVLAMIDYAVAHGLADPDRLGVGGHSYGGILTDATIARTTRFKAAVVDAGQGNAFAGYGTDQYVREYELELGTPWAHPELYQRVSYAFFHADKITTPTLFLCGEKDFNVPLVNSEQMYQAVKSTGHEAELVIYPGQYHEFTKPSFITDKYERILAWYDRHLR